MSSNLSATTIVNGSGRNLGFKVGSTGSDKQTSMAGKIRISRYLTYFQRRAPTSKKNNHLNTSPKGFQWDDRGEYEETVLRKVGHSLTFRRLGNKMSLPANDGLSKAESVSVV